MDNFLSKLYKSLIKLIQAAEEASLKEGVHPTQRKLLVMFWVILLFREFLNRDPRWYERWLISRQVDKLARALPSNDIRTPLTYGGFYESQ